jgi:serralysin
VATLFANLAFDINNLDLHLLQGATDFVFANDAYYRARGITYEDLASFELNYGSSYVTFGGASFSANSYAPTGGTVTGVVEEIWNGVGYTVAWGLERIHVSAMSLWNASLTTGKADDVRVIAGMMSGADNLFMSGYADRVRGYAGNDQLFGRGGNDVLYGDAGSDLLSGGAGLDYLFGGDGADRFKYQTAAESTVGVGGRDVIRDFVRGVDRIDLAGIDANTGTAGNSAFTRFIGANQVFTAAGQLKFSNGVLYGNTDGDATAEFAIALTGITGLSTADVIL